MAMSKETARILEEVVVDIVIRHGTTEDLTPAECNAPRVIYLEDTKEFCVSRGDGTYENITDEIKNMDESLRVLKARVDSMLSLPEGATTNDAVLNDIKIGHDGKDWGSPGEAVRGQVSQLSESITEMDNQLKSYEDVAITINDGFVNAAYSTKKLTINDNANWSYTIIEPNSTKIYLTCNNMSKGVPTIYQFDENDVLVGSAVTLEVQRYIDYEITVESGVKKIAINTARYTKDDLKIKDEAFSEIPIIERVKKLEDESGYIQDGSITPEKTFFIKIVASANIYNRDKDTQGLINSFGEIDTNRTDFFCTEKIEIEPDTIYAFMGFIRVVWFKADNSVSSSVMSSLQGSWMKLDSLTSPSDAKYFIACMTAAQRNTGKPMVIKDATEVPDFIPYEKRKYLAGIENDNHSVTDKMRKTGLYGKRIGFLGDSYTYGLAGTPIQDWIAERTGMIAVNYGVSGSTICTDAHTSVQSFNERYPSMDNNLDGVVVFGGINDSNLIYHEFINMDTFKDGLSTLLDGLIDKYPLKPIIAILPPQIQLNDSTKENATHLSGVVDAEIEIYGKYSIPFVDLFHSGGFYMGSSNQVSVYAPSTDNIHKNSLWGKVASKPVQKLLETWCTE